ncbi:hypothetical protein CFC21_064650 [Triticum aestivum]|uniref:Embryonic flower 1 n=2 Tax=Triticum aestivum TaxID=4565 RepID=A0A9R1H133_WHEAT|nr:uncharacterized protein LOC123060793 [Triticum aestivum]XP_044339570.1 uncharacterized protein LOC123060793 [Triticum aestivum]KAF7057351.1 hypothetical protein CFC21_064650 [Triticum aestivum]
MEVAAVEESDGGTSAAPAELPKREGAVVAETDHTSAEQPCKHFSICGYVSQKMDAKFCSLSQSFSAQQQLDERHNSLHPFSVAKFRRWDCSMCLDELKILDDRTTSRAVFTAKNVSRDGCSIRFVQSTLVPTSVDFRSLFPCTQLLAPEKNPDRSALLKSNIENNSKCNSPYEAKTDPPMKDLQGPSTNQVTTANISDNASVDIMALPEDSQIRVSREGNAIAIPSSSKLSEASMKLDSEENGKNKEVLSVDHTIPKVAKPISGQKGDQVGNSGPCEEAAPKRSIGSTYKKKKGKRTAQVGSSDVKVGRRKQIKLRLLSEIINTDLVGGSRSDIEVNGEKVADLCEDDRSTDDVPSVDHQAVGDILSKTTKNVSKDKGVDVEDDESSLMNWMKRIPKRLRTEKKDSEHKDCDSSASKSTADVFASKDTQDFPSSGWKLSKKNTLPTTSMQQGDENIQNDNLERNTQSTDDMRRMEAENSTERFLSNVKTISLSKRKMPLTASIQHDGVVPVSRQMLREISSKTAKKKAKYKGVDAVDDEGSSLMDWMKRIPKKLRTEKKDAEYKDNDSSAANSKYNTVDKVALKDVQDDFISSAQELSKRKIPPTASTREGDENIQNDNLERDAQNTNGMCETESDNCRQRSLSKVKKMSLCKRKIPSTVNAQHDDVNTKETAVLRTDDQCQMVPRKSVQRRLKKVSPGKHVIRNVTVFEQKLPKKRNKKKQEVMHEKNAMTDDIPMDIVELLARCQGKRPLIAETDSADISHTQSKIMEDEDCTIIAAEDGPNYVSSVIDTTSQQKRPLEPDSYQNALQNCVAATTQATHMHARKLQTPGHVMSTQEPQAHSGMGELVTIAATSPLLSPDKDQPLAEATPERWSHMGAKKSMWEPFKALPRDLSTTTGCAQFRPSIDTVDLTYTDVAGANRYYPTRQPVISTLDHYTNRAVNSVQARSFPSSVSTMEAGNLCDGRNVGHSGFYPRETMPATQPLRLTESPMLASFNYEGSSRNQMEFQLRNSHYAQDQSIGSASTPYGAHNQYIGSASTLCEAHNHYIGLTSSLCGAHNQYIGSASTPYGSNLNGMGSASTQYGSNLNGMGSASTSYGSNLNGRIPLTLEDLSRHPLQPNLHRPLRPLPRVGVFSSLLQKEIADWSESCGTQSGYKIGVSKGITSSDINRRGNVEALNSGLYSAAWNARRLSSVSSSPGFSSVRNDTAQSWTRDQGRMANPNPNPLDRLVRQDICVTNRNPCDFTTISDDNEYMRADI